jgi:methionyl-tRNA formyltransferase
MEKSHGRIDFSRPARAVHDLVRGMSPWPGAYTTRDGARIKVHRTRVVVEDGQRGEPGVVVRADPHGIEVSCGEGILSLDELQLEGKRKMKAAELLAGHSIPPGTRLGS